MPPTSGPETSPAQNVSTVGAAIAGKTMARARHYKRVAIVGTACAVLAGGALSLVTMPLWGLLALLSVYALGLGTVFPVSVVSVQNSVMRFQVGTATGAMNFFRALMASFMVAAFSAILLMSLGADISLGGEHRGPVNSIAAAEPRPAACRTVPQRIPHCRSVTARRCSRQPG